MLLFNIKAAHRQDVWSRLGQLCVILYCIICENELSSSGGLGNLNVVSLYMFYLLRMLLESGILTLFL